MSSGYVEVRGLREFRAQLKKMDAQLPKDLRREFRQIAVLVLGRVRAKVPSREAAMALSATTGGGGEWAGISRPKTTGLPWRGKRGMFYNWLDWGGSVGRGHIPNVGGSGAVKRPFIKGDGRYLYPTIKEARPEIRRRAIDTLNDAAGDADLDVSFG